MAPSRRTTAGLAPKQVSPDNSGNGHDGDIRHTRRSQREQSSKNNRASLANGKQKNGYKKHTNGVGIADDSLTGEDGNDDAEDGDEKDDHDEHDDDPEAFAPSDGMDDNDQELRADSASTQSSEQEADDRQAGLLIDTNTTITTRNKKRTFSNVSVLTTDEDSNTNHDFPRKKTDRRLSENNGRLMYQAIRAELKACISDKNENDAVIASDDDEDDDVYAVLDEAIDSNDDTSDELEAQAMLAAVEDSSDDQSVEDSQDGGDSPQSFEIDFDENDDVLPDDGMYIEFHDAGDFEEIAGWHRAKSGPRPTISLERKKSDVSERRVHFDDHPKVHMHSSSSSSTSSEEFEGFPDLLSQVDDSIVPQEQLDPTLLQQIEEAHRDAELGNYEASDSGSSYWDFGESLDNAMAWHDRPRSGSEGEGSDESDETMEGYECKFTVLKKMACTANVILNQADGDTTDDDIPPPATISKPRTHLHRRSPPSKVIATSPSKAFPRNKRRKGPVMGTFTTDNTKPYATYDHRTNSILIEFPRSSFNGLGNGVSSSSTSPNMSFQGMDFFSDMPSLFPAASADVMMSGLFGGHPGQRLEQDGSWVWSQADLFGGQIGLPDSFYPSIALGADGSPLAETEGVYSTEEDDEDEDMDIHAFIDMTHLPSDNEEDGLDLEETETTDAQEATSTVNLRDRSASQLLLEHLDRHASTVGAFKNHQDRFRLVSKLPQDMSLIATPLKTGKTAEDLMSPLRKRKSRSKAIPQ